MSVSDCDSSSHGGNKHQNFREVSRHRLLFEMIGSTVRPDSKSNRKVLLMDKVTLKIMSNLCKMTELTEGGISLVEDINKQRQPQTKWDAVYYIQPTKENVFTLLADMAGKKPLYRNAYIFFSSPTPQELIAYITSEPRIKSRLRVIKEINLEYVVIDSQCFITDHGKALEDLYGDEEIHPKGDEYLAAMANRIATVFVSMSEFPLVRYRAAKSTTKTTFCDMLPSKLAAAVWNCLMKYKTLNNFPQTETCELLILDRSIDQIAPIIHEWTNDAICHDLLELDGNKSVQEIAARIHSIRQETGVNDVGKLERDLVFGDAGTKDVINILKQQRGLTNECKVRLLMIYVATHPKEFESDKLTKLMELANLYPDNMNAVYNMRFLRATHVMKPSTSAFSLKFHYKKKKHGLKKNSPGEESNRKNSPGEESTTQLSHFHPMIEELIEKLDKNKLPMNEYPCMHDPNPTNYGDSHSMSQSVRDTHARSHRSKPSTSASSGDGYSSDSSLTRTNSELKKMGKRIFIFIVGGATRSELRVCHELSTKLRREIILGSSSLDDPTLFVEKLKSLTSNSNKILLDDLEI